MLTIYIREIQDMIKSLRFLSLLVVALILFGFNGVYFGERIAQRQEVFNQGLEASGSYKSLDFAVCFGNLPLMTFAAEGDVLDRAAAYLVDVTGNLQKRTILNGQDRLEDSPWNNEHLPVVPPLDWVFIVTVVFSIYAILLGFDSVAGERVQGTLCLTLSNHLGRSRVLIAKYFSICTALLIPLAAGILLSLIIIMRSHPSIITSEVLISVLIIFLISCAFLSMFVFLTLFVSVLFRQPSTVLLVTFCIWLAFTIIPALAFTIAKWISTERPPYQIAREYNQIRQKMDQNAFYRRLRSGEFETAAEAEAAGNRQMQDWARTRRQLKNSYENNIIERHTTVRRISRFSPISLFTYILEAISGTGFEHELRFAESVLGFSDVYQTYVKDKTGVSDIPYALGSWNASLNGERLKIGTKLPPAKGDLDDFPIYTSAPTTFDSVVEEAGLELSGLLLWNLILAMGAFLAFNRADVR